MTPYELMLRPAGLANPRNGEGAVIELNDGTLLLAYSQFYQSAAGDFGPARVMGSHSMDRGRTWSPSFLLVENEALTTFSVSLLRLPSGEMRIAYCRKLPGEDSRPWMQSPDCRYWMRSSSDEGKSWSDAWCITPEEGYFVVNNDRFVQLSSGRLIQPAAKIPTNTTQDDPYHSLSMVFYSDDDGHTWLPSSVRLDLEAVDGLQEPGVVELNDGTLMLWARTSKGCQYRTWSQDRGETWSPVEPIPKLISPVSPASIKRIPQTGDLLAIFNRQQPDLSLHRRYRGRHPLTAAISRDEGHSWQGFRNIETDTTYDYDYASITFLDDEVLLTYHKTEILGVGEGRYYRHLKLTLLPVCWFYDQ